MMLGSNVRRAFTFGELLVVIAITVTALALLLPAIQRVRAAANRLKCKNNLRQIGIAMHHYHADHGAFPPGCSYKNGADPTPHMSWCTRLLPYLEQDSTWAQALQDYQQQPFFLGPPIHRGFSRPMKIFVCPADGRSTGDPGGFIAGFTHYLGVGGRNQDTLDGSLYLDSKVGVSNITDGSSNTLLVGERPPSAKADLGWWYAGWGQLKNGSGDSVLGVRELNRYFNAVGCPSGPYHFQPGEPDNQCDAFHFWSVHTGGAHFLFADGSVHFLSYDIDPLMPAFSTRAGGETAVVPD